MSDFMTSHGFGQKKSSTMTESFDFESCGGTLHALDDGHVPETFADSEQGAWIHYPEMEQSPPQVHVYDNVLPTNIVDELYEATVHEGQPWGSYVTMDQVTEYWESPHDNDEGSSSLALTAVAGFLTTMMSGAGTTARIIPRHPSPSLNSDNIGDIHDGVAPLVKSNNNIHGVAIWALASDCGRSEVGYHVDYA
jgi:hypothetical protein